MGVAASTRVSDLGTNPILKTLVGTKSVPLDDPYWDKLLDFQFVLLKNRYSP